MDYMKKIKCVKCRVKFEVDEVRSKYNSAFYKYSKYDYDYPPGYEKCEDCAFEEANRKTENTERSGSEPACNSWCGGWPGSCSGCNLGGNRD